MKKMAKKTAHLLSRNILSTAVVIALMGAAAFAAAPTGGYLPGATLDPDCAPGDADCMVLNVGTESDPLRKFVEGSGSINAVYTGGNVGIGVSDPQYRIDLGGDQYIDTKINSLGSYTSLGQELSGAATVLGDNVIPSTDINKMEIQTTHGSYGARAIRMRYHATPGIEFHATGGAVAEGDDFDSTRMFISNSGNVGINNTSPRSKLEVEGSTIISGGNITDKTHELYVERDGSTNTLGLGPNLRLDDKTLSNNVAIQNSQGALTFWNFSSGTSWSERMRISPEGFIGIGDNDPKSPLDLGSHYANPGVTPNKISLWNGGDDNYMGFGVSSGDLDYISQNNHRFYTQYNGTPGTEKMTILANGNVGIKESAPVRTLDIGGTNPTFRLNGDSNSHYPSIQISSVTGDTWMHNYGGSTIAGSSRLNFRTNSTNGYTGDVPMVLLNKNVGIGTTNPIAPLQVAGEATTTHDFNYNLVLQDTRTLDAGIGAGISFGGPYLDTGTLTTLGGIWSERDDAISGNYGASLNFGARRHGYGLFTNMTISSTGSVGIGTQSPSQKLEVAGDVKIDNGGNYSSLLIGSGINDRIIADNNPSLLYGGGYWFRVHDETKANKYRDVMMLAENGNVGVNTKSPDELFSVSGDGNWEMGLTTVDGITRGANATDDGLITVDGNLMFQVDDNQNQTGYFQFYDGNEALIAQIDEAGNALFNGTVTESSDERLKENITEIDYALDKIEQIDGVTFTWKNSEKMGAGTNMGVIAQDVELVFPELVHTRDDEKGTKSVNYGGLVAPLIEAVKELKVQNETLAQMNADLIERVERLESMR